MAFQRNERTPEDLEFPDIYSNHAMVAFSKGIFVVNAKSLQNLSDMFPQAIETIEYMRRIEECREPELNEFYIGLLRDCFKGNPNPLTIFISGQQIAFTP